MAAPNGTVWGSVAGGYGKIGIYVGISTTNTNATVTIEAWLWTKWSCVDANNSYYFNNNATTATTKISSININHQISSGTEWDTRNQTKLGTHTYTYDRGTSSKNISCAALLKDVDKIGAQMTVSTSYTVPAKPSYTITYNANGGSGAPSSQTKWYGTSITLSTTKPTRNGYTFQGWATSASGSVAYAAGASFSANANTTLYAVWKANTYTVEYDANGGSGAPGSQSKTHDTALTLSSTKPTRANYTFRGWGTSASSTEVKYSPGASYTTNASIKLYAVWTLAYTEPTIYNYTVSRCTVDGADLLTGAYAMVKFDWKTTYSSPSLSIAWTSASAESGSVSGITLVGSSGTFSRKIGGSLAPDASYMVTVTITDDNGSNFATTTLGGSKFPIDFLPGGRGVGIGKPAELAGVADFALAAKFNGPVFGNVAGLNKLPSIPINSDLNDYMMTGCWAVYQNATATTIANIPVDVAGRLEVYSATGEGIRPAQYSYLRQRYIPYNAANAVWEREVVRGADNVWKYYDWWRTSLDAATSTKVYKEQTALWTGAMYMTAGHNIDLPEAISKQPNGIVLVFSTYASGAPQDEWFSSFFVPKSAVDLHSGKGFEFIMAKNTFASITCKYLFISNSRITGDSNNNASGTANGVTYNNAAFVLRHVIGV